MTTDVLIRPARAQDATALAELAAVSFRAAYADGQQATTERYIADHYGPGKQAAELADHRLLYLVVELESALIGFAMLAYGEGHPDVAASRPIRLSRIYVAPASIGSGIGSRLMERCVEHAGERRHDVIWLSVWEENTRAVVFYDRWGFAAVGEMTFDFAGEPQRDFVMSRPVAR